MGPVTLGGAGWNPEALQMGFFLHLSNKNADSDLKSWLLTRNRDPHHKDTIVIQDITCYQLYICI